jgi:hypothetical protein
MQVIQAAAAERLPLLKNMKGDTDRANLAISDSGDTNGGHTAI